MKTYGQYCALARALDIVGDRWTLLVVRELLVGEASYGELQHGLPGVATNLLAERLRFLQERGVVERVGTGRSTRYRLTERGRQLEEVVHCLVRWGAPEMTRGAEGATFRPGWLAVALGALASPHEVGGRIGFLVDDTVVAVDLESGTSRLVDQGDAPDVTIQAGAETVLGLAAGLVPLREAVASGQAVVRGGVRSAERMLARLRGSRDSERSVAKGSLGSRTHGRPGT